MRKIIFLLLSFTLAIIVASCGLSEGDEGETWSHKEMIEYLKSEGLTFKAVETDFGSFFGPAMNFEFSSEVVYVQLKKTSQDAKDYSSTKGDKAFAWGRFYFEGESNILTQIKEILS